MDTYLLFFILLFAALFEYYIFHIEPKCLKLEVCELGREDGRLKAVHLTDLHFRDLKVNFKKIYRIIERESPDIIAITGDMFEKPDDTIYLDQFLSSMKRSCPVYITLGNHDLKALRNEGEIDAFRESLKKHRDVYLLHNETALVTKGSNTFDIIGITDAQSAYYSAVKANEIISGASGRRIVLTHNPDAALSIVPGSCRLIISGHLHGGQVWLPFNFEFILLRKDILPKQGYKKGLYTVNGNKIYISRGLGTSFIPARFLSRPEITVFYL
jgi:predicted MPP superfamily phosphohydrolase